MDERNEIFSTPVTPKANQKGNCYLLALAHSFEDQELVQLLFLGCLELFQLEELSWTKHPPMRREMVKKCRRFRAIGRLGMYLHKVFTLVSSTTPSS